MAPQSKRTRKFEKKHLKDTLERRKDFAKIKQRAQTRDKKKARNAKDRATEAENRGSTLQSEVQKADDDMTVDQFFQGGFEIVNQKAPESSNKRKRAADDASLQSDDSVNQSEADDNLIEQHEDDLKSLAQTDPEFHKFLEENDAELLEFGGDEDDFSDTASKDQSGQIEVTNAMIQKWQAAMAEKQSLRAMREMALAFRAAVHVNEEDNKSFKYVVSSPEVYHELLLSALSHIPPVLEHHLPLQTTKGNKVRRVVTDSKKFRSLSPLLKSHAASIDTLLNTLSDEKSLNLALKHLTTLVPYLLAFRKAVKKIAMTVIDVWSEPSNRTSTRINAFLFLEQVVIAADVPLRETILKNIYQGMVKASRTTTPHTLKAINILKNTAARLWGVDPTVGYTTAFALIRQLAVHLRSSISQPTKDSYKAVYNWQFVHSLDFWSRVLSLFCNTTLEAENGNPSPLRPLIYPLTQITLGTARLIPTPQYFSLRFHLVRSLDRLAVATVTYIPLAPLLLEVLESPTIRKPGKPSMLRPLPLTTTLRSSQSYLNTRVFADSIGSEAAHLIAEVLTPWATNIAFPELSLPIAVALNRWMKGVSKRETGNRNAELNAKVKLVIEKISANAAWITKKREGVTFAPGNTAEARAFLKDARLEDTPLGAFVKTIKHQRSQKEQELERARREEEEDRGNSGSSAEEDGDGAFEASEDE